MCLVFIGRLPRVSHQQVNVGVCVSISHRQIYRYIHIILQINMPVSETTKKVQPIIHHIVHADDIKATQTVKCCIIMNKTQIPCVDTETIKHFHQNVNDISISTPQARWHATVLTSGYRNWLLLQRICSFQAGLRSLDPVQTSDQQVQAWSCQETWLLCWQW